MDQQIVPQNKYVIQKLLGKGGFADVRQCVDDNGNKYAIKVFKKSQDDHIQNEIKIQSMLKSPYIVKYIESIREADSSRIILEFCSGGDMQKQLEIDQKQFTEPEVMQFLRFILSAYYELISNGIIHRDLKPANIFMHEGQYKLGDFGISKTVENYDQVIVEKITIGSYQYMSPQLFKGKYTAKCDIWSLGIIIYYCNYQELPWGDIKAYKNINQYFNFDARVLKFKNKPKISDELRDIIEKCLKYEETDRCSWSELMNHPKLNSFQFSILQCQEKQIIDTIRKHVKEKQINSQDLFGQHTHHIQEPLKMSQFICILKAFNPDINYSEVAYLFKKLDKEGQFRVEVYCLRTWFIQNKK